MTDIIQRLAGKYGLAIVFISALGLVGTCYANVPKEVSFTGHWVGTGIVTLNGKSDPIYCKVRNINKAGKIYYSTFNCVVPGLGKGSLTILSEQVEPNRYIGSFKDEYNHTNIKLKGQQTGNTLDVVVNSSSWNGTLTLYKKEK